MRRVVASLGPSLDALRLTLVDLDLRRLMLGWFAVWAGKGAFLVVNLVIAYDVGGPVAVGILGLASYLPTAILAPFAGVPVARWRAERVLFGSHVVRVVAVLLAIAVVASGASIEWLYLAVAIDSAAGALTRSLHMALLPCLARTPAQLVAANVTSSASEGVGSFVGPAIGALLLATTGALGADLAVLALYGAAAIAVAAVTAPDVGRGDGSVGAVVAQLSAGVRALARLPGPRLVTIGFGLQTFVRGLLTVLIVVAAIDLLDMGDPGVGLLTAAIGLGGVVGAIAAITLAGRARLVPPYAVALAMWGLPILVMGLLVSPAVAVAAMLVVGLSNAMLDVAGFTLIQRTSPNESRVAVLGLVESVAAAGPALGGLVAPVLIAALGIQAALVVSGAVLPIAAVALWPFLRRVDEGGAAPAGRVALIRGVPLFAPLSLASVEHLAGRLQPIRFDTGAWLMREGEPGDRFVILEHGSAVISRGGHILHTEGPGAGIGEIALLQDIPRTASAQALEPIEAQTLGRAAFLEAVTGTASSQAMALAFVRTRLAADAAG